MAPKKRKSARGKSATEPNDGEDEHHSVLGGMNGGHRVGTTIPGNDDDNEDFKVPFNDKEIICEGRGVHRNRDAGPSLIFTHGAGGGIATPATRDFARGFAEVAPVVCFQGTMNLQSRVKTFHAVIEHTKGNEAALGGRSLGARAAVLSSQDHETKALVLVSYPLVGGKKGDVRDQILLDLPETVDVLFMTGSEDKMCDLQQLTSVTEKMNARCWIVTVQGADHGMSIKQKAGIEALRRKTGAVAADWLKAHDEEGRFCSAEWDAERSEAVSSPWKKQAIDAQNTEPVDDGKGGDTAELKPPAKKKRKTR